MRVKLKRHDTHTWTLFISLTTKQTLELVEVASMTDRAVTVWPDMEASMAEVARLSHIEDNADGAFNLTINVEIDLMAYLENYYEDHGEHDTRSNADILQGLLSDVGDSLSDHISDFDYNAPVGVDVGVEVDR